MTYNVDYERDETGRWVASVREVSGCHTPGRTVGEARRRIREALGLFVNDPDKAKLIDHVALPQSVSNAITEYKALREQSDTAARLATRRAKEAIQFLCQRGGSKWRLSVRDTADLLDLSHQRVQQLMSAPRRPTRRKAG
jgi:predicted RNase H-like HicB family nuclease